ncbi:MAG: hypothetical protein AB1405_12110 [Bdellovibrionota bacterium]
MISRKKSLSDWAATWFSEFSVLWAVFPLLDQLTSDGSKVDWMVVGWGWGISLIAASIGLYLKITDANHREKGE